MNHESLVNEVKRLDAALAVESREVALNAVLARYKDVLSEVVVQHPDAAQILAAERATAARVWTGCFLFCASVGVLVLGAVIKSGATMIGAFIVGVASLCIILRQHESAGSTTTSTLRPDCAYTAFRAWLTPALVEAACEEALIQRYAQLAAEAAARGIKS